MLVPYCIGSIVLSWLLAAVVATGLGGRIAAAHEEPQKAAAPKTLPWVQQTADDATGFRPVSADGKPLNFDFETGTLANWTADGEAFKEQPVKGDIPSGPRARDGNRADPQGEFWIGTFERAADAPQGTLTSVAFKVTHPFATFLAGGGPHAQTRVAATADMPSRNPKRPGTRVDTSEQFSGTIVRQLPYEQPVFRMASSSKMNPS
jgi:hypothetical protein